MLNIVLKKMLTLRMTFDMVKRFCDVWKFDECGVVLFGEGLMTEAKNGEVEELRSMFGGHVATIKLWSGRGLGNISWMSIIEAGVEVGGITQFSECWDSSLCAYITDDIGAVAPVAMVGEWWRVRWDFLSEVHITKVVRWVWCCWVMCRLRLSGPLKTASQEWPLLIFLHLKSSRL